MLFSFLFSLKAHAYWEYHIHARVVVFVVVVLVRDAVDALQLVRAPRGYDDIVVLLSQYLLILARFLVIVASSIGPPSLLSM